LTFNLAQYDQSGALHKLPVMGRSQNGNH